MTQPGSLQRVDALDLLIDRENEEKLASHGPSSRQVPQILQNAHVVISNRKRRRADVLPIGRDNGGTCITVPLESTSDPSLWRPMTAWRSTPSEGAGLPESH